MFTIRRFIGAYGSIQLALSFLAVLGISSIYILHDAFCHQQADRSFHITGEQLSLCARCMGVYLGLIVAAVIQSHATIIHSQLSPLLKRNLVIIMALSFVILAGEKYLLEPSNIDVGNIARFVVGIGLGYCLAIVVFFLWDPKEANPFKLKPIKTK